MLLLAYLTYLLCSLSIKWLNLVPFFFLVPIRSCREFYERCRRRRDGVYTVYLQDVHMAKEQKVFCDMSHNEGGWTLLVTSTSKKEWTNQNIKKRNEDKPSISKDYSILQEGDTIKSISVGPFLYKLEVSERGAYGGIWSAPQGYRFVTYFSF